MARRRSKGSRGHVSYARAGIMPRDSRPFRPVRARGGENGLLREPRSAIREHPLLFVAGAFAAGIIGTLFVKNAMHV